jgi:hypothetical protein
MKPLRIRAAVLVAPVIVALGAGTALAAQSVSFKGTYKGTATEKVDGQTVTAAVSGAGTGSVVGKGRLTGTVTATTANPPCSPLNGPGTISGKSGNLKLVLVTPAPGCAPTDEDQTSSTLAGTAQGKGGTAKFKKARGTLHFSGHYDRKAGTFTVTLTGSLSY